MSFSLPSSYFLTASPPPWTPTTASFFRSLSQLPLALILLVLMLLTFIIHTYIKHMEAEAGHINNKLTTGFLTLNTTDIWGNYFLWRGCLIARCLAAAFLASIQQMLAAPPPILVMTLPNVPRDKNCPQLRATDLKVLNFQNHLCIYIYVKPKLLSHVCLIQLYLFSVLPT